METTFQIKYLTQRWTQSGLFFKVRALFTIFKIGQGRRPPHRKTPEFESLFNKAAGPQVNKFIEKRLQQRCFPLNISKFLRTSILKKICERVRLNRVLYVSHKVFIETLYLKSCLNCFNSLIVKRFLLKVYNKASFMFYSAPQLLLHVQF